MEFESPIGDAREDFWRFDGSREELQIGTALPALTCDGGSFRQLGHKLADVAPLDGRLHQDIFDENRDLASFLRERREREAIFRARQGDVEKPALFLNVKLFGRLAFFHQSGGKFEHAGALCRGEFLAVDAQEKNLRKFEAFGSVNGHQLDGVARKILFETDRSARLRIVAEVFDKFGEAARLAFGLPFLDKFGEAPDVFAVLRARALRDFQPFEEIREDFARAAAAQSLSLLRSELHKTAERGV